MRFCYGSPLRQEEKGMTRDEMVRWRHWLDGHEFVQALGDGEGQGGLLCRSPWCHKEQDRTERLNNSSKWANRGVYKENANNIWISSKYKSLFRLTQSCPKCVPRKLATVTIKMKGGFRAHANLGNCGLDSQPRFSAAGLLRAFNRRRYKLWTWLIRAMCHPWHLSLPHFSSPIHGQFLMILSFKHFLNYFISTWNSWNLGCSILAWQFHFLNISWISSRLPTELPQKPGPNDLRLRFTARPYWQASPHPLGALQAAVHSAAAEGLPKHRLDYASSLIAERLQ